MLSYMLPAVDEKPPPGGPSPKGHMHLSLGAGGGVGTGSIGGSRGPEALTNGRTVVVASGGGGSPVISKETSISSFISDATTTTATSHSSMTSTSTSDKGGCSISKPKLVINGGKHPTLKRVSFGSSKGSMVETLIFESPVQEEPEPSPVPEKVVPFPEDQDHQNEVEREKVRVTFFQQSKPQEVDLPDEPAFFQDTNDFVMAATQVAMMNDSNHIVYNRTESTESGWENPFRPGGDLSREADEIVELIKGGKPITPTPGSQAPPLPSLDSSDGTTANSHNNSTIILNSTANEPITETPKKATELQNSALPTSRNAAVKNGTRNAATPRTTTATGQQQTAATPGVVDVKKGTVKPDGDASQVEHVTLKKKPKCKCCVIQ